MTQQLYETTKLPAPTIYSRQGRMVVVTLLAIFAVGIGNVIYSVRH